MEAAVSYRARTASTITAHGGRFLVRGGEIDVKEGERPFGRVILLEFPDLAHARAWYDSPAYQVIVGLRQSSARTDLVFLQGWS